MRHTHRLIFFLPALLALPAIAASPLEAALNASVEGPLYTYDIEFESGEYTATARVDPSQPEGQRVTVTSPPEAERDDELLEAVAEMESDADGDIWCKDFGEVVPPDAKLIAETETTATFSFKPQPEADSPDEAKFFKHLIGQVTIDTVNPGIIELKMEAPKPFKPMMIARIKTFNMHVSCAAAPDGRRYLERLVTDVSGSAAMQKFDEREVLSIRNLVGVAAN